MGGFQVLAPVVMLASSASACQDGAQRAEAASAPIATKAPADLAPYSVASPDNGPMSLGTFSLTFYYVINEDEVVRAKPPAVVAANDNQASGPAALAEPSSADAALAAMAMAPNDTVPIYSPTCEAIADVSPEFAGQLRIQGTGKLRDGRVLNVWGECSCARSPCYQVTSQQWGRSGTGHPLDPFRTVAVDPRVVKLGSLLFIPALEGRTMPGRAPWGGFVHDGCVIADDTGGGIKNTQLDLFVGRKAWWAGLATRGGSHLWSRSIQVYDGSAICERRDHKITRKSGAI